ncbi:MAG: hypothetical protein K8R21_10330 [Leptospira sp.]|nr:hypothetical protein [Leptospira sp.]
MKSFIHGKYCFLFLVFLFTSPLFSETVLLRSGEILRGNVVEQSAKSLRLKLENGNEKVIDKDRILKVVYKSMSDLEAEKLHREELKIAKEREAATAREKEEQAAKKKSESDVRVATEERKRGPISKWGIVARSAILPGWGHWKAGERKKGIIYSSLFLGSGLISFFLSNTARHSQKEYDSLIIASNILSNQFRQTGLSSFADFSLSQKLSHSEKEAKQNAANFQYSLGIVAIVYIGQLVHAYLTGVNFEKGNPGSAREGLDFHAISTVVGNFSSENSFQRESEFSLLFRMVYE